MSGSESRQSVRTLCLTCRYDEPPTTRIDITTPPFQVWDASSNAFITFNRNEEPLAHVVENDLVLDSVFQSIEPLSNVTVKYDSRIENFRLASEESESGSVFLKSGEEFSCNLLVSP